MIGSCYKYSYRLGYGSSKMLIEIFQGVENTSFLRDLFTTINSINPRVNEIIDLWQNDEVLYEVSSSIGDFILSKDIWGYAFIIANNNQAALITIDTLLLNSQVFFKVLVDKDQ